MEPEKMLELEVLDVLNRLKQDHRFLIDLLNLRVSFKNKYIVYLRNSVTTLNGAFVTKKTPLKFYNNIYGKVVYGRRPHIDFVPVEENQYEIIDGTHPVSLRCTKTRNGLLTIDKGYKINGELADFLLRKIVSNTTQREAKDSLRSLLWEIVANMRYNSNGTATLYTRPLEDEIIRLTVQSSQVQATAVFLDSPKILLVHTVKLFGHDIIKVERFIEEFERTINLWVLNNSKSIKLFEEGEKYDS